MSSPQSPRFLFLRNLTLTCKTFIYVVSLWGLLGGFARAETPIKMTPLQGDWQAVDGSWQTKGERPPAGWYLRSERQFNIGAFTLELKKTAADDFVFVYLRDWEICLRPDSMTVRYQGLVNKDVKRFGGQYWYTATRPYNVKTTDWRRFSFEITQGGIDVQSDGKQVLFF